MDLTHVIARDKSVLDVKSFLRVNPDVEITGTHLLMACKLNNGAMFPVLVKHGGKTIGSTFEHCTFDPKPKH